MIDPLQVLTLVIGGGGLIGSLVAVRKARPEARNLDANTAAVIATTAGKWVTDADERMARMQRQLNDLTAAQQSQSAAIEIHARWDRKVLAALDNAGINDLPPAPPLYLPQTG